MCSFIPNEELANLRMGLETTEVCPFGHGTTQADCHSIFAEADFTLKLSHRYRKVVCDSIQQIDHFNVEVYPACENYDFQPVLVADGVNQSVYSRLPRYVGAYYVEMSVQSGKLYIKDLSLYTPRLIGVGELVGQASMWCKVSGFQALQRHAVAHHLHSSAPDVSITARPYFIPPGLPHFSRTAVIELEISNRSVARMRRDFVRYFDEPVVCSVVVIKMFPGTGKSSCQSAVAVQWTRQPGQNVIEVHFGIVPISASSVAQFEAEWPILEERILPPVSRDLWAAHRSAPVSATELSGLPDTSNLEQYTKAVGDYVHNLLPTQCTTALFQNIAPTVRVNGGLLRTILHDLPPAWPVDTDDLVLDLGSLFYTVQTSSGAPLPTETN